MSGSSGYKSRKPFYAHYSLNGQVLETVPDFLGLTYQVACPGAPIKIGSPAMQQKPLNLSGEMSKLNWHPGVREMACSTIVMPQLEYAAAVWDPHTKGKTKQVEKVQRRAARWGSCSYDRLASVSAMIATLGACQTVSSLGKDLIRVMNSLHLVENSQYIASPRTKLSTSRHNS